MSSNRDGGYGLGKGPGPSDLDNVVHARAMRPLPGARTPIRIMTVIYGVIGPKGANPLKLLVRGRCRDDCGSHSLGDLQCKD